MHHAVLDYAVRLVMATRDPAAWGIPPLAPHIGARREPARDARPARGGARARRVARPSVPRAAGRLRRRARGAAPPSDPHVRRARRRHRRRRRHRGRARERCRNPGHAAPGRRGSAGNRVTDDRRRRPRRPTASRRSREGGPAAPPRAPGDAAPRRHVARRVPRPAARTRNRDAGTRRYEAGDDARRIDWNLTARSLTPQLRTTDADRELQTWVVVDRSASMDFGTAVQEKRDVAFAAVAAFGFLTARHGNRFGVIDRRRRSRRAARPVVDPAAPCSRSLSRLYDVPRRETPPAAEARSRRAPCKRSNAPARGAARSS